MVEVASLLGRCGRWRLVDQFMSMFDSRNIKREWFKAEAAERIADSSVLQMDLDLVPYMG